MQRTKSTIVPILKIKDMQKSLDFYTKRLGFRTTEQHTLENQQIVRASVGFDSTLITLSLMKDVRTPQRQEEPVTNNLGGGVEFCIHMNGSKRLHELFAEMGRTGIPTVSGPDPRSWSDRLFSVTDPDGYVVSFGQRVDTVAPQGTTLKVARVRRVTRSMPYNSIFGSR